MDPEVTEEARRAEDVQRTWATQAIAFIRKIESERSRCFAAAALANDRLAAAQTQLDGWRSRAIELENENGDASRKLADSCGELLAARKLALQVAMACHVKADSGDQIDTILSRVMDAFQHIKCAYCGREFEKDFGGTGIDEAIRRHVESCTKHPLAAWSEENKRLTVSVKDLREQVVTLEADNAFRKKQALELAEKLARERAASAEGLRMLERHCNEEAKGKDKLIETLQAKNELLIAAIKEKEKPRAWLRALAGWLGLLRKP